MKKKDEDSISNLPTAWARRQIHNTMLRSLVVTALLFIGSVAASGAAANLSRAARTRQVTKTIGGNSILKWEGHTKWGDGDESRCKSLQLTADNQAMIGACGGKREAKGFFGGIDQEWADIQNRFAPFTYKSATDRLVFRGKGQLAGLAWQRAVVAWAHSIYGTLYGGRRSATGLNVMEWWYMNNEVPGKPDKCGVLAVRGIGDASASTFPCGQTGGTVEENFSGWLATKEWEVFDKWLYHRAGLEIDGNNFYGRGKRKMNRRERAELSHWAKSVFTRLLRQK